MVTQIRDSARDVGLPGVDPAFGHGIVDPLAALGGPPAAPHPSARVGADEPNDTPSDATPLAIGTTHGAHIAPETDEDWYTVNFAATGWYSIQVPAGPSALDHEMDPVVELYHSDHSFATSQELTGGDLVFQISVTGDYFVHVRNINGSTAAYTIVVRSTTKPPTFAPSADFDFSTAAASVGVADVNGDGRPDALLAFGDNSDLPDTLAVFTQTSNRSLSVFAALPTDVMTGGGMATGDLDGDTRADVAIPVSGGIDVFTDLTPTSTPTFITQNGVTSVAIADVDGDTHGDIVAVGSFGVKVFWGPSFATSTLVSGTATSATVAAGDVSKHGDGRLDIVTCCVKVFQQTASRVFAGASGTPLRARRMSPSATRARTPCPTSPRACAPRTGR